MKTSKKNNSVSPWKWIPTLYIAEGLPYFAVNTLTVLMYFNIGISKADMAFFTGWLYLPWVIKPFWSPFIDLFRSKRWWIIIMQYLMAFSLSAVAFLLPGSHFFISTLIVFWIIAFFSATHDVAADGYYILALDSHSQAAFVGVRSTFYRIASIAGQGGLVMLAGYLEMSTDNIPVAWAYVFALLSAFFLIIAIYHTFMLPFGAKDHPVEGVTRKTIAKDFINTFITFFKKPHIFAAILFMLLYRFPEALCIKLVPPFFVDSVGEGGLGLSTTQAGFINGTVGVIGLLIGGIAGGLAISRFGLKRLLWLMGASLSLPCVFYCFLAMWQPEGMHIISTAVFLEQFGYGFGFTAYMMYLLYFSRGENATSHYAFCTAFMAVGMMVPGMFAGWILEWLADFYFISDVSSSYVNFFWFVVVSSLVTFLAISLIKVDPRFGKKDFNARLPEDSSSEINTHPQDAQVSQMVE